MTTDVLTHRALNRATLARQLLLERSAMTPLDAVEHLVGLQAQVHRDPYLALWSRLEGFRPDDLSQLFIDRAVVRIVVMRGTIHLVTADDALALRPAMQEVLDKELVRSQEVGPKLDGVDLTPVLAFAHPLLTAAPRTTGQLRTALAEQFPKHDAAALAYACRNHVACVQVPPRGLWQQSSQVTLMSVDGWLGRPVNPASSIDDIAFRYFAAFGPATVADLTSWSRLTGQRAIVERLRHRLRTFRDESGRELFDLPDAPRPDPDTPAPPRFLPEYDNVLLSHSDRSRFTAPDHDGGISLAPTARGTVMHDGLVCGSWRLEADSTLVVDPVRRLTKRAASAVTAEGQRALRVIAPGVDDVEVRIESPARQTA